MKSNSALFLRSQMRVVSRRPAKNLAGGLEPELSVAVDVMFPDSTLSRAP